MNIDLCSFLVILYYEERSQIYVFDCFPNYNELIKIKNDFIGLSSYQISEIKEKSLIYQNINRQTFYINDAESYNRLSKIINQEKHNKMQIYIINNLELSIDIFSNQICDLSNQVSNVKELSNSKDEVLSEGGKSTSQMTLKNYNEKFGIKKSEKHVKALFLWAKIAKNKLEKEGNSLISEDGKRKYNICANISNKNVNLVVNDVHTKRKIKSRQILIYRNSFNFGWSNDEGGERLKNLILCLITNFDLISIYHDLSKF